MPGSWWPSLCNCRQQIVGVREVTLDRVVVMSENRGSRAAILEIVRAHPGLPQSRILDATGLSRTTVSYHLRVLQRQGRVRLAKRGGLLHAAPQNDRPTDTPSDPILPPIARALLRQIRDRGPAGPSLLARNVGISTRRVSRELRLLHDVGLLARSASYHPSYSLTRKGASSLARLRDSQSVASRSGRAASRPPA